MKMLPILNIYNHEADITDQLDSGNVSNHLIRSAL